MADIKISEMSTATALAGAEWLPLVQGGDNLKASLFALTEFASSYAFMVLASNYTLTSSTATQKLFNVGASGNGAITVETGIYVVRTQLYLSSMSSTSGNGTFDILGAGTATIGNSLRHSVGIDNTTPTTAATQTGAWSINTATNNLASNGTGTALGVTIHGFMVVEDAGTIIPSIALANAAAAVVNAPSHIILNKIGPAGATYGGSVN